MIVNKPWGWYENLYESDLGYKVKRLFVNPNQRISLQYHFKRGEHWVVVEGDGIVTLNEDFIKVKVGSYIFIPEKAEHRVESGDNGVMLVEVQQGTLCDEDDIVRLEDDYSRV